MLMIIYKDNIKIISIFQCLLEDEGLSYKVTQYSMDGISYYLFKLYYRSLLLRCVEILCKKPDLIIIRFTHSKFEMHKYVTG